MVRWLWSRFMKWGWDFSRNYSNEDIRGTLRGRNSIVEVSDEEGSIDLPDPIRFKVQAVNGGTLIETRWYNHKKDESYVKLHIVTQDENLADSIGKIVTMELLQK